MARELLRRRRACADETCSNPPSPKPARMSRTILDTPRRTKLLADARAYAGKMPRKQLFRIHNVAERTGYHILKQGNMRRGPGVHNQGRKRILPDHQCAAIKAVEDANFAFASSSHAAVARTIGLTEESEHTIQQNMTDFDMKTYRALQKK